MLKIAHRGYTQDYNGNTLNAIKSAIDNKFDMIELDIQLDKYNNIILFHDIYLNNRLVNTLSYREIKYEVPDLLTLSQFFSQIDYKNIKIYFDLKGDNKLGHELHSFLIKQSISISNIWFGSFNLQHIDILSKKDRPYKLGLITMNNYTPDILSFIVAKYSLKFVCFDWSILNSGIVGFLRNMNVLVFFYTLTNENKYFLEDISIDGIVSDIIIQN